MMGWRPQDDELEHARAKCMGMIHGCDGANQYACRNPAHKRVVVPADVAPERVAEPL